MNHFQNIIKYYEETEIDYKLGWNYKTTGIPALHFGYYDEKATNHQQALIRHNEILSELANIQPHEKVLDAGCGLGNSSCWLAKEKNANVVGISLVQRQVDKATAYAKKNNVKNIDFIVANYLHTPFEDNSFDVVWAIESVCYAEEKALFLKEAFRILKPGGRVVIADFCRKSRTMDEHDEKFLKDAFSGWEVLDIDTLDEYITNSSTIGFINIAYNNISKNVYQSYKNLQQLTKKWLWLTRTLVFFKIADKVRYKNGKSSNYQFEALNKKIFQYYHFCARKPLAK